MGATSVRGKQIKDDDVTRADLNTTVSGSAVITKLIAGSKISLSSTGVDTGTGDVTISVNGVVSSVGLNIGTDGSDVNVTNSPITSTGSITLNIPHASGTARGLVNTTYQTFAGVKSFYADTLYLTSSSGTIASFVGGFQGSSIGSLSFLNGGIELIANPVSSYGISLRSGTYGLLMGLNHSGTVIIPSLAGTGSRMVVTDASGNLSTQTLPSITDTNIYTTNGTLTANRTVGLSSYNLDIVGSSTIRFTSSGRVIIGTTTDLGAPYTLQVSGSIYAFSDVVAFSDARVKTNIRPIDNALEKIEKSRGVMYDRTDIDSVDNIGFIAQELEEQFPELIVTAPSGLKSVKYQNAVAVLFEAVKELNKKINYLSENLS